MNHEVSRKSIRERKDNDRAALLLIDLISDFQFQDGDELFENTKLIAANIGELRKRAKDAGMPVIYVNDNCGNWQEDFDQQVKRIAGSQKGSEIISHVHPEKDDYYVLKPQRSGFYETPLAFLLTSMNIGTVILAGVTTDICILFTAHDAFMRGYDVHVPTDCSAAVSSEYHHDAIKMLERVAKADVSPYRSIPLAAHSG
jgi:nicotinamidase-related amidase